MFHKMLFVLLLATMLLTSACGGAYAIQGATLRNTIFSLEPRTNGSLIIWMTNDDIGSYCISSGNASLSLRRAATTIFNDRQHIPTVYIRYSTINVGGEGYQILGLGEGCPDESGSGHVTYIVTAICRVEENIDTYSNCTSVFEN